MKFQVIGTMAGFHELEDEWKALFAQSDASGNIFASFEWHRAVLSTYGSLFNSGKHQLAIVVGRRHGKVELICPLVLVKSFGTRVLNWIGSPVSQYGDAIANLGKAQPYLVEAAFEFVANTTRADALVLQNVQGGSAVARALERTNALVLKQRNAPQTNLEGFETAKGYTASLTATRRKKHRRLWKRLSEVGEVKFEIHAPCAKAALRTQQAMALKRKSLEEQGTFSRAFSDEKFEPFFHALASDENVNVGFQIGTIALGEKLIAAEIGFKNCDTYIAHVGVYDSDYKKFAPGHLLIERMLGACIESGIKHYDFLAPEDDYKQSWSTHSADVIDFSLPKTKAGYLYCSAMKMAVPAAKALKNVLPQSFLRLAALK